MAAPDSSVRLVIATPCYGGQVTSHYMTSMLNLQRACIERGIDHVVKLLGHDSLIPRARNILVSQFLDDPQATHLLFIDADIGFAPERVFALLEAGYDVAGAVYPMKMLDWSRIAAQAKAGAAQLKSSALNYVVDFVDPAKPEIQGNFARVKQVGTGFMMIKRSVFERMATQYPALKYNGYRKNTNRELNSPNTYAFFDTMIDPTDGDYLSEDYAFCRRWTDLGGAIWADASSKLTHVGTVPFEGDLPSMLANLTKSN
ncbi:MAG TPA: hypothetical protein VGG27_01690 [Magnetospirillaceae bacterium]|jgi:hypothetical protein